MNLDLLDVVCMSSLAGVLILSALFAIARQREYWWFGIFYILAGTLILFSSMVENAIRLNKLSLSFDERMVLDRRSDLFRDAGASLIWLAGALSTTYTRRHRSSAPPASRNKIVFTWVMTGLMLLLALMYFLRAYDAYSFLQSVQASVGFFP